MSQILLLIGVTLMNIAFIHGSEVGASSPANGLGDRINWLTLEDGTSKAKAEGKPLMLIIHKSWCGACKSLKPKIAESDEIFALSQKFVMVNTMDEDEPKASDDRYTPDGGYIPRILFFSPEGNLFYDEINAGGNEKFKYYYYDEESIAESMERVLLKVAAEQLQSTEEGTSIPEDGHSEL